MHLHERKDEQMNPHVDTNGHDTNCLIFITGKRGFVIGQGSIVKTNYINYRISRK